LDRPFFFFRDYSVLENNTLAAGRTSIDPIFVIEHFLRPPGRFHVFPADKICGVQYLLSLLRRVTPFALRVFYLYTENISKRLANISIDRSSRALLPFSPFSPHLREIPPRIKDLLLRGGLILPDLPAP